MNYRFVQLNLLLCLALSGYRAPAQRICDLEAICISPADTVINGKSLVLRFGRKNMGPDIMFKNDTSYYTVYRIVDGQKSIDYSGAFIGGGGTNDTVPVGDSTIYRDNYGISFNYPGLTEPLVLDYCGQIDSWKRNAWGDTVGFSYLDTHALNNTCCKQVVVMPAPQTTAIATLQDPVGFSVFPNPAGQTLYLHIPAGNRSEDIEVYLLDLIGRKVLARHAAELPQRNGLLTIDIGQLSAGLYLVHFVTPGGSTTKKVSVNR